MRGTRGARGGRAGGGGAGARAAGTRRGAGGWGGRDPGGRPVRVPAAPASRAPLPVRAAGPDGGPSTEGGLGMKPELKEMLDQFVGSNPVVLFMKGTKDAPRCGFSNTAVQILRSSRVEFEALDVLEFPEVRSAMKEYSQWPTFPQVYIGGEFFGGCDILMAAYESGELQETLERVGLE